MIAMNNYYIISPDGNLEPCQDPLALLFGDADNYALYHSRQDILFSPSSADWRCINFPLEVAVELAAWCNLDCVMCPVPTTKRPKQLMKDDLFRKIIGQIKEEKGYIFGPGGFGEVMLHSGWAELVEYAIENGIKPILMLTNGTVLNEANANKLIQMEVDALIVSIDGVNPETYSKIRVGGSLDKVEANVKRLLKLRGDSKLPRLCLRIIRMKDTEAEIQQFMERWTPILSTGDLLHIQHFQDWAEKVSDRSITSEEAQHSIVRGPCRMLWRNLSVHADGKVSACCHDSEDELIVGDVTEEDLHTIWHGVKLNRLRSLHMENKFSEIPICNKCKAWV
jgi:radical SAM protein with 4Fe4S-binding SPASM domain